MGYPTPFFKTKIMKIEFLEPMAGKFEVYEVGVVYEFEKEWAKRLIASSIAVEYIDETVKKAEKKVVKKVVKKKK